MIEAIAELAATLPATDHLALVLIGALLGGFVLGLTGFGNGLAAYGIWLHVLPPEVGAPLVAIGAVAGHAFMFRGFQHDMIGARLRPIIIGGLCGIPIGTYLLSMVSVSQFKLFAGLLLASYSLISLAGGLQVKITRQHWLPDAIAGFAGGICGGLASLSGPIMTLWCGIKGWDKDAQRAAYQPYNFVMLSAAFISFATAGFVTQPLLVLIAATLPTTLIGVWAGRKVYGHIDDEMFKRIVLVLLTGSAITLIWGSLRP